VSERMPRVFLLPARAGPESVRVRLGPRPDGFRFSPEGAWSTFGLPGRRYAWIRDVSILGGARAEEGGTATAAELLELAEQGSQRRDDAAAAAAFMQQLDSMLHFWRDMPPLPSAAGLEDAEQARPFEFPERPPAAPDLERERALFERERLEASRRDPPVPRGWTAAAAGLAVALALGGALLALGAALGVALAGGVAAAWAARRGGALAAARWARRRAIRQAQREWPAREERLCAAWRYAWAEWDLRRAQARVGWHGSELERIGRVRRLRAGEAASARRCLEATLADLDFPYAATCELATDGETAYLVLDLPDVDAVVPTARAEVDEELALREVPLAPVERHEAYAEHVAGVALLVARAAFAAVPGLKRVQLAGCRQRAKGPSGKVEYLVDVLVDRENAERLDPQRVDPGAYLAILPGRFEQGAGCQLAPLPPPPWLSEAFDARAPGAPSWKN